MSSRLIVLEKKPGVRPVGVEETWILLFAKCLMRVTGPESTSACQDEHLCAIIKAVIDRTVHGVQAIWYTNFTTEYW